MDTNGGRLTEHSGDAPVDSVLVAVPDELRPDIPLLSENEQRLLALWNATQQDHLQDAGGQSFLAAQATATPDAVALATDDQWSATTS